MSIDAGDVVAGYRILLGREPESPEAIEIHSNAESVMTFVGSLVGCEEFVGRMRSPFFNYVASFDAIGTMRRHEVPGVDAEPPFFRNFLGVRMRETYLPHVLLGRQGTVEAIPIPSNWHADIAEWAAVLRAVDLARERFTVVELGCGWGCWLNNAGVAARTRGLEVRQIGVEGDEGHVAMARDAGTINGFAEDRYRVHHGLAAARSGTALFPYQPASGIDWGLAPILDASEEFKTRAVAAGTHAALPVIALDDLTRDVGIVDLLHIDIQGGEADLVEEAIDFLNAKVAYLFVGTHSRAIEGRLHQSLLGAGWSLEIERPAIYRLGVGPEPHLLVDGAMGWRNPRLAPL